MFLLSATYVLVLLAALLTPADVVVQLSVVPVVAEIFVRPAVVVVPVADAVVLQIVQSAAAAADVALPALVPAVAGVVVLLPASPAAAAVVAPTLHCLLPPFALQHAAEAVAQLFLPAVAHAVWPATALQKVVPLHHSLPAAHPSAS